MSEALLFLFACAGTAMALTQSVIAAPLRDWFDRCAEAAEKSESERIAALESEELRNAAEKAIKIHPLRAAHKLATCPMCSGFWIGLAWAPILGIRGAWIPACGFAGSIASAIGVGAWIALEEAHHALALWRYLNNPKDP